MGTLKSIVAVVAGFVTIITLVSLTDMALTSTGVFPASPEQYTAPLLLIALVYRTAFAVVAGLVVAKLAPAKPMKHVVILAAIGVVIGTAGVIAGLGKVGYPLWYSVALTLLTFPAIWYGGRLAGGKKHTNK